LYLGEQFSRQIKSTQKRSKESNGGGKSSIGLSSKRQEYRTNNLPIDKKQLQRSEQVAQTDSASE
jgi:hypothetical protein